MRKSALLIALVSSVSIGSALAQAPAGGEEAFWASVKTSDKAAEVEAFLKAFPNGAYAQIARLRLDELTRQATAPAAPPPQQQAATPPAQPPRPPVVPAQPPAAGGGGGAGGGLQPARPPQTAQLSSAAIKEIQERLYNLNYDPGKATGVMNETTQKAIREWQKVIGVAQTGEMDDAQLQRLRGARLPTQWAAIAYTNTGAHGWVFGRPNRAKAETDAIDLCNKNAKGGDCSDPITTSGSWCVSLASYSTKRGTQTLTGARVSARQNMTEATQAAMNACASSENSQGNCQSRVTICADGSHRK